MNDSIKITDNGVFLKIKTPLIQGWQKAEKPEDLAWFADSIDKPPQEGLHWTGAKIPMSVFAYVIGTIRKFPKMEVGFMLYYNTQRNMWRVHCPKQFGHGAAVHFEDDPSQVNGGFFPVGTIHTHPNMGAFWSGTDLADQKGRYGLHMMFGLRDGQIVESKITLFTPVKGSDIPHHEIFADDVDFSADCPEKQDWVRTIMLQFDPKFQLKVGDRTYGPHEQEKPKRPRKQKKPEEMTDKELCRYLKRIGFDGC